MQHASAANGPYESAEDLVAAAMAAGHMVTRHQLRRWQQAGLLPSPTQEGRGRGQGTRVWYPRGASRQLLALLGQLAGDRSIDRARWRLWWSGFLVDEARIRATLSSVLDWLEENARHAGAIDDPDDPQSDAMAAAVERWAHGRKVGALRHLRARTRRHFPTFVAFMVQVASGRFEDWSPDVEKAVGRTLDIATSPVPGAGGETALMSKSDFRALSSALRPELLRASYAAATWKDVEDARDELRSVIPAVKALFTSPAVSSIPAIAMLAELLSEQELREQEPTHLLVWLYARRLDIVRRVYGQWATVVDNVRAGITAAITDQRVEVDRE